MNTRRFSSRPTNAVRFLWVAAALLSASLWVGCSSTTTHTDAGGAGGLPGSSGAGGGSGGRSGSGSGGRAGSGGSNGSGGRAAGDAGTDARASGGAGGTIITVDAAGNTLTCADLLTCCNRVTNAQLMAACLQQYNTLRTQGDPACGNLLTQIRANGGCP